MKVLTRQEARNIAQVRLVTEEGAQIVSTETALRQAFDIGLDLVLVGEAANPPVCKILDLKKVLYEQKKAKPKHRTSVLKEVQIKLNITEHDMETKLNQIRRFLDAGDKVKLNVKLKGRERERREHIENLIKSVVSKVECKASSTGFGIALLERKSTT